LWEKIKNLIIQEDDSSVVDRDKEGKIIGCFINLFKAFDLSKFTHLTDLVSRLMRKLFLNYEKDQDGIYIKYLSDISMVFMNNDLINIFIQSTDDILQKLESFNHKINDLLKSCLNEQNYSNIVNLSLIINLKIGLNSDNLLNNYLKTEVDFNKFINYMFVNEDSLLLSATAVQNIKIQFQKILFTNTLVYNYLIDGFFIKDKKFFSYFTTKSQIGLDMSAVNNFVKYLISFNENEKQSISLLESMNEEIIENLKNVLKFILQNPNQKSINKFLTFSSSYLNLKHDQKNFKNLWSFMFDLINLEIIFADSELSLTIQNVCMLCVGLLNIENSTDLTCYLASSFENNKVDILNVVFKLIEYLKTRNEHENLNTFLIGLFNSQLNNQAIYENLCETCLSSTYLRAYTETGDLLLLSSDSSSLIVEKWEKFDSNEKLSLLKRLNFGVKLLNKYSIRLNHEMDFYYLISNCLILKYYNFYRKSEMIYLNSIEKEIEILILNHTIENGFCIDEKNCEINFLFLSQLINVYKTNSKNDLLKQLYSQFRFKKDDDLNIQHIQRALFYDFNYLTNDQKEYKFEQEIEYFEELEAKIISLNDLYSQDKDKFLIESTFNLNILIKYTKLLMESSELKILKDILVPVLGRILDNMIDLKLNENSNTDNNFLFTSFYDLLFHYIKCMQINVEEMSKFYPKNISSEWNGFFSKEIFDPLLVYYVKMANKLGEKTDENLNYLELNAISKITATMSLIPAVRLSFNELEINLNAKDYSVLNSSTLKSAFNLNDKLQTIINTLYPLLNHPYRQIQMSSFLILDKLMVSLSDYYKINEIVDEGMLAEDTDILKLLPNVIQESLFSNVKLISRMKNEFNFEESLVEDLETELGSSHNLIAYFYTSKLLLNLLSTDTNLEFKFKLISNFRDHKFDDNLINCLFRLMPKNPIFSSNLNLFDYSSRNGLCNDEWNLFSIADFDFNSFYIQKYSCDLYKHALKLIPALIRDWWNRQGKRISDYVDRFTSKYVSPVLIVNEMKQINLNNLSIGSSNTFNKNIDDEYESVIKIKGFEKTREVVTVYKVKDLTMELVLRLPYDYPLGKIYFRSKDAN